MANTEQLSECWPWLRSLCVAAWPARLHRTIMLKLSSKATIKASGVLEIMDGIIAEGAGNSLAQLLEIRCVASFVVLERTELRLKLADEHDVPQQSSLSSLIG